METLWDTLWGGTVGFVFNECKLTDDSVETVKKAAKECGEDINNPALQRKLSSKRSYYRKKGEKAVSKIQGKYRDALDSYVAGKVKNSVTFKGVAEVVVGDIPTYLEAFEERNEVQRDLSP